MVYVEKKVVDDGSLMKDETFSVIRNQLCTFREGTDTSLSWIGVIGRQDLHNH